MIIFGRWNNKFIYALLRSIKIKYFFARRRYDTKANFFSVMALFDRSHTSSYSPSTVTTAISCIVCEI